MKMLCTSPENCRHPNRSVAHQPHSPPFHRCPLQSPTRHAQRTTESFLNMFYFHGIFMAKFTFNTEKSMIWNNGHEPQPFAFNFDWFTVVCVVCTHYVRVMCDSRCLHYGYNIFVENLVHTNAYIVFFHASFLLCVFGCWLNVADVAHTRFHFISFFLFDVVVGACNRNSLV